MIVPAGDDLLAYTGANVGSGTATLREAPAVSGTPVATEAVGADVGVWTALPTSYTYQWLLCDASGSNCSNISSGGTGESYTPSTGQIGDTLEVTVTATNTSGTSSAVTSAPSGQIVQPLPSNQALPAISGTPVPGQTLTATAGSWANNPTSYDYQWLHCQGSTCTPIAGATSNTYSVTSADAPNGFKVAVTANNGTGSGLATSAATATVPYATSVTLTSSPNPAATGATVTLTASVSPAVNGGTLSFAENGQPIPGCTPFAMSSDLISVSCIGPFEQPGVYAITATYSGSAGWQGSSASLTQVITGNSLTQTIVPVGVTIATSPSPLVNSPTIDYTESGPVTSTACMLDGVSTPCSTSAAVLSDLGAGQHTFEVAVSGTDVSASAQVSWVITTSTEVAKVTSHKSKSHKNKKKKKKKKPGKQAQPKPKAKKPKKG